MDIFTTMITPYLKDGGVDYETAERYVDFYAESGISGIFAVCQSSEIFYLTLDERVELNRRVYARAKAWEKKLGRPFKVVSSGHISDTHEEQVRELNAVWQSGTDALILITNRLDPQNEGDDVFLSRLQAIVDALPADVRFGLYECPYPYKRLVTPRILEYCRSTGRFDYMKDTCCDAEMMRERCRILAGSGFRLLNANCQTLLESIEGGADGYCGIMCNFHPRLYAYLGEHYLDDKDTVRTLQGLIGTFGFTEVGLPYPLTAKYHMNLCGIPTELITRKPGGGEMTDYAKSCVEQMKLASDNLQQLIAN